MAERRMDVVVRVSTDAREAAADLRAYADEVERIGASGAEAAEGLQGAAEASAQLGEAGREAGQGINEDLGDAPELSEKMSDGFKSAAASLAALVSIEGLRRFVGYLLEAGQHARELQQRLEFTTGGPQAAAEQLKALGGTAAELGESLDEVARAYALLGRDTSGPEQAGALFEELAKVAKDAQVGIGETVAAWRTAKEAGLAFTSDAVTGYANIAAASGKTLTEIVGAVAEAAEGNYAALEDFGIGVREGGDRLVVDFRGQSVEIRNDAETLIEKLQEIGNVDFAGANAAGMKETTSAMDKLAAAVEALAAQMAQDSGLVGGMESLGGGLDDVTIALAQAQAQAGEAGPFFRAFGKTLDWLSGPASAVTLNLDDVGEGSEWLLGKLAALIRQVNGVGETAQQAGPPVQTLAQIMKEIGPKAQDSAARVEGLDAKLQALGVNVKDLNAQAQDTAGAFDAFDAMIRSSDVSGGGMVLGLEAALRRVSEADLPRVAQAWEAARVAGQITSEQYAAGVAQIEARLKTLPAAIDPIEAAFTDLGVSSQADLDALAAKARAAFEVIASGQVPLARLQEAFDAYAEAAAAANNGVVPAAVRAEAAQRGLAVALDATGNAAGRARNASRGAAGALDAQASASGRATKAQAEHSAALSKGEQRLAASKSAQAAEAAEIARANAIKAASWEQVNAAQITYGQWADRTGSADAQRLGSQQALATAVGQQSEKVRELSLALADAQAKNAQFAAGQDAFGAAELSQKLAAAKVEAEQLKAQLAAIPGQPVTPEVDDSEIKGVKKEIDALDGVTTYSQHAVKSNVPEVAADIQSLDGKNTTSTHTIVVKKVETNNAGGVVGLGALLRHDGGSIFRRPAWSLVPGVGHTDSVPAGLPTGAYVLRQAATRYYGPLLKRLNRGGLVNTLLTPGERWFAPTVVRRHGTPFFEALNRLEVPRAELSAALSGSLARFNAGGSVGGATVTAGAQDVVKVELSVGRTQVKMQSARDQAQSLVRALSELQRGR